ncbi:MAG: DUF1318 domain-containing protein [Bdellovibrionota bacterium]
MKQARVKRNASLFGKGFGLLAALALISCVTVHVNFPESAVQRAADDFVRDLYGSPASVAQTDEANAADEAAGVKKSVKKSTPKKQGKVPAAAAPASNSPSTPKKDSTQPTSWIFEVFVSSAYAGPASKPKEITLDENLYNAKAQGHYKAMKGRASKVVSLKQAGLVCEQSDGTLKETSDDDEVKKFIETENSDRRGFYSEVSKTTGQDAQAIYGKKIRDSMPSAACK